MVLSFFRIAVYVVALAIAVCAVPSLAAASDLAIAQGTVAVFEGRPGLRAPSCAELVVQARDALDNHLIAETQPTMDQVGSCRYALSVPAQTAIWLRLQTVLVAGVRVVNGTDANVAGSGRAPALSSSVALRFTIIAPMTYFFEPNEKKTITLRY